MAQPIKVPVHYTTAFKNQYSRNSRTRQIEAGRASRVLSALFAFALVAGLWLGVFIGAILAN